MYDRLTALTKLVEDLNERFTQQPPVFASWSTFPNRVEELEEQVRRMENRIQGLQSVQTRQYAVLHKLEKLDKLDRIRKLDGEHEHVVEKSATTEPSASKPVDTTTSDE